MFVKKLLGALGACALSAPLDPPLSPSSQQLRWPLTWLTNHCPLVLKSQIAHLDMHHLVFGIDFQIHSVSLTILVSIHLVVVVVVIA